MKSSQLKISMAALTQAIFFLNWNMSILFLSIKRQKKLIPRWQVHFLLRGLGKLKVYLHNGILTTAAGPPILSPLCGLLLLERLIQLFIWIKDYKKYVITCIYEEASRRWLDEISPVKRAQRLRAVLQKDYWSKWDK